MEKGGIYTCQSSTVGRVTAVTSVGPRSATANSVTVAVPSTSRPEFERHGRRDRATVPCHRDYGYGAQPYRAQTIADNAVRTFSGVGMFGVEMFLIGYGTEYMNEIAPR